MLIYRCNQCGFTSEEPHALMRLHATLTHVTPMQLKENWLDLFHKRPYDRPGCDR